MIDKRVSLLYNQPDNCVAVVEFVEIKPLGLTISSLLL